MGVKWNTGSSTHVGRLCFSRAVATALIVEVEASMPRYGIRDEKGKIGDGTRTNLDNVNANVIDTGVDLFGNECRGNIMDIEYALGILGSQRRRRCHGVALMDGNDSLVGFEATGWKSKSDIGEQQKERN